VILHFNYEEIQALRAGARAYLGRVGGANSSALLAPSETRVHVVALIPHLAGYLLLSTIAVLRAVQGAVRALVEVIRVQLE
jgi:hypothetical protein